MKSMMNLTSTQVWYDTTSCIVFNTVVDQVIVLGQNITTNSGGAQVYQYSLSGTRIA